VSIMRLTAGLDSGPVCLQAAEPVSREDTYGTLSARLRELAAGLLLRTLQERPQCAEQPEEGVSYAEKIAAGDRLLDPVRPAAELERTVRALHPHIGARVSLGEGRLLGVQRAAVLSEDAELAAGLVAASGRLLLHCTPGILELLQVQPAGGRPMEAAAYLRGHQPGRR
jgi:methionyl-tRNA formyltransferase